MTWTKWKRKGARWDTGRKIKINAQLKNKMGFLFSVLESLECYIAMLRQQYDCLAISCLVLVEQSLRDPLFQCKRFLSQIFWLFKAGQDKSVLINQLLLL